MRIAEHAVRAGIPRVLLPALMLGAAAAVSCDDPARPIPPPLGAVLFVDSEPQGGRILIDGDDTGEVTPALVAQIEAGVRAVVVELDTAGVTYSWSALVVADPEVADSLAGPLTVRCSTALCLRNAAQFHSAGNIRFAVNAAGPLFLYEGLDLGIVWPASTSNTYVSVGAATMTALVGSEPVALGLRNAGTATNYWAGRPVPAIVSTTPYRVRVPAWLTPTTSIQTTLRGVEVVQEVIATADLPDVLTIRVTWRNISADSLYRLLDPASPVQGVTYTDVYVGFILDPDVGAFGESTDDLVSYDADRKLVFAYDANVEVSGFSGGWSDRPGLIGLALLEGPGDLVRLNAWPTAMDFGASVSDAAGRVLITAEQSTPANHEDPRIGYAPDQAGDDYIMSVANGPLTLAPGDSVSARFAVLLAEPDAGTFQSGQLLPAGDPTDPTRPLTATAAGLFELADQLVGTALAGRTSD